MGKIIKMYNTPFQKRPLESYKWRGWANKAFKKTTKMMIKLSKKINSMQSIKCNI